MTDSMTSSHLADVLAALGWSPERLARRLNAFAEQQGRTERIHPKTPYKWVAGDTPRPPWRALTAALLTEVLHREITPGGLGWPDDDLECLPADAGLVVPWDAEGTLRALHTVTQAGAMDRRLFLLLLGSAATSPAHEWLIAHQNGNTAHAAGSNVPMQVVDHLDQITDRLRRMDDQLGGGQLLTLVHQHLRYVTALLDQRRYTDSVGRRLHGTAGELLRLAGFLCFDSGLHARAQRYWIAALHAAHAAGDRALGANILGFQSCQAKDIGQTREAITLAETARAGYRGASPAVTAILELRAAEAHANEQAAGRTRKAIDAAFDALGRTPSSSGPPDWCYWMDEAQAHAQAGYCYLKLGDHTRARSHLRHGLALQDSSYSREGALRQVLLATTYLQQNQPELDQTLAYGSRAINALSGEVDSARCIGHLSRLVNGLGPYRRSAGVAEFLDRARPLLTAGTP
jgi:tetratricopeptide (TPR) repeat protein